MSEIPYHRIAQRFFNRGLLLQPSSAEVISGVLLKHMAGRGALIDEGAASSVELFSLTKTETGSVEAHRPRASRFVGSTPIDAQGRPAPYRRTPDGTAIITMIGELVNRGAWIGASSGLVSYEGFTFQLQQAAADPNVKAIVIDMETPGGEATGAFEAAAAVRAAREVKPVVAMVNGLAASAGYLIASGATRIASIPSGYAGSIGVVMLHLDYSQYLADEGIKPTLIFAGAHKVDGNPFQPLPEQVREKFQAESQAFYEQFVSAVAAGRKGLSAAKIRATEAQLFSGQDAIAAGLVDSVGTFDEVLADMSRGTRRTSTSSKGSSQMSNATGEPAANAAGNVETDKVLTVVTITSTAALLAAYPALCTDLQMQAATTERDRMLAIEATAMPGHEAIVDAHKKDPTKTAGDCALAINAAAKGKLTAAHAALATDEKELKDLRSESGAAAGKTSKPDAAAIAKAAASYRDEMAAKGVTISATDAVAHIEKTLAA